jgi:Zn-dependent protease with chaperone function
VTKPRTVLGLLLATALLGAVAVGLAGVAALSNVSAELPSPAALVAACRSILLPSASVADLTVLLLGSAAFAAVALGVRSAFGHARRTRRFLRGLKNPGEVMLSGKRVTVFDDRRPLAFCAGALRPRIWISTATVEVLDDEQLSAVVAHEAHHARVRDPLRVLAARVLSDALFFLPAARRLGRRYEELAELAADQAALRASGGRPAPLASALLSLEATGSAVVGIAPERVDHLVGEPTRWDLPLALLGGAAVTLIGITAVASRLHGTAGMPLNLPLFAAQSCMLIMAVAPLVVGAFVLVRARGRRRG